MPSRRNQIELTPEEQQDVLSQGRTLYVATNGHDGYPHMVAMWYVPIDGNIHFATFRKSQKVLNIQRDPRITVILESGLAYNELRALVIKGTAELVDDLDLTKRVLTLSGMRAGLAAAGKSAAVDPQMPITIGAGVEAQATKRVTVRITPDHIYSWDHSKLGGRY